MRKLPLAILAAVLVTSAVFAGGGRQQSSGGGGGLRTVAVCVPSMGPVPRGLPEVQEAINRIVEPSGIRINLTIIEVGSWAATVPVMMASQEKIDLMLAVPVPTTLFDTMVAQNQLMDITDIVNQHGSDLIKVVQNVIPSWLEGTKVNGRLFGVGGLFNKVNSYYYLARSDLLDKYGIDISKMKSLDDTEAGLVKIKAGEPSLSPLGSGIDGAVAAFYYPDLPFIEEVPFEAYGIIGGVFVDNPYKVINNYATPQYKDRLHKLRDWYLDGFIYKDAAINKEMPEQLIKNNIAFSWFMDSEMGVEASKSAQTGKQLRAVKFHDNLVNTTLMRKFAWVVPAYSKEAEAAVKFLNLLYSRADVSTLFTWGIEGRDYVLKSDGTATYPSGVTAQTAAYHSMDFLGANQYLVPPWEGNPADLRQQVLKENQGARASPLFGFSYDPTPVQVENVAVQNVLSQYTPGLESGSVDPDVNLPLMLNALERAGVQKIIDEIQRQLDAWRAATAR